MAITASALRADIYRVLDRVLETGESVEIQRGDRRLRIVPVNPPSRLQKLIPHVGTIVGDPEDLVHMDWSTQWQPDL